MVCGHHLLNLFLEDATSNEEPGPKKKIATSLNNHWGGCSLLWCWLSWNGSQSFQTTVAKHHKCSAFSIHGPAIAKATPQASTKCPPAVATTDTLPATDSQVEHAKSGTPSPVSPCPSRISGSTSHVSRVKTPSEAMGSVLWPK